MIVELKIPILPCSPKRVKKGGGGGQNGGVNDFFEFW